MRNLFAKKDVVFIGVLLMVGLLLFVVRWICVQTPGDRIEITVDGELYGTYDLAEDQEIPIYIQGEWTDTVTIENGEAYMSDASCPDHLCMKMGHIAKDQETIVCLPYKIVVTVVSSTSSSYDTVVQ